MSECLELWLSPGEAVWSGVEEGPVRVTGLTLDRTIEAAFNVLRGSKHRRWPRRRVRVRLAGALAQPFVVDAIAGLRSWSEVEAAAMASAASSTGLPPPLRTGVARWPPSLGIAASAGVLECLLASAQASGARLISASPWWLHRWTRSAAGAGSCIRLWRDPSALTVLVVQGESVQAAFSEAPRLDEASEAALIQRLRVAFGPEMSECLVESWEDALGVPPAAARRGWFAANGSMSAERRLDLVRVDAPSPAMWAIPVGLAIAVAGLHLGAARWSDRETRPAVAATEAGAADPRRHATAAAMRDEFESGWPQLLAAFEAAIVDGIVCESLDVDVPARSARLRLAFDELAALDRYVRALNAELRTRRAPWEWSLLTADMAGDGQRRATLEARRAH